MRGKHVRARVARAARKRMRGRDLRFQSFIPVAEYQPRRRSPCIAKSPVMESTLCGFLFPEESGSVPSILELHAAWEATFVDDVNIGDIARRSAQPEKSLPGTRKLSCGYGFCVLRRPRGIVSQVLSQKVPVLPVCVWISRTPRHSVLRKMFAIYGSEADVDPRRTSWLAMEVRPYAVRVARRFHVQEILRRFHTHFPAVPRSTSVRVLSRLGRRRGSSRMQALARHCHSLVFAFPQHVCEGT
jgi:hypothetical protein